MAEAPQVEAQEGQAPVMTRSSTELAVEGQEKEMSKPLKFRKKPVVIHAVQWDGDLATLDPLWPLTDQPHVEQDIGDPALIIPTLEGKMRAEVGDWIICGVQGELY